jgi:hypothetical protein
MTDAAKATSTDLSETLTKVIRLLPDTVAALDTPDGQAAALAAWRVFLTKMAAKGYSLTQVQVLVGSKSLTDLMKEKDNLRSMVGQTWDDFESLAHAKGYTTMTAIATVIGEDKGTLRSWKSQDMVPLRVISKMSRAPDVVTAPKTKSSRTDTTTEETLRQKNPRFKAFMDRYPDLVPPIKSEKTKKNGPAETFMTADEMKQIGLALFGDNHLIGCLSYITGYDTSTTGRQLAGKREIGKNLADFLRDLAERDKLSSAA